MAQDRVNMKIKEGQLGEVRIADDVVAIIAALAATEVEGVVSMNGNITAEIINKLTKNNLSKGVKITVDDNKVTADLMLNIGYGYEIPSVCEEVQKKVKTAIENMTGLEVLAVNVRIANVDIKKENEKA